MSEKKRRKFLIISFFLFLFFAFSLQAGANSLLDSDKDGVPDSDEINLYHTDPQKADTDSDGYNDFVELNKGYSPHFKDLTLSESDFDGDGLNDRMELNFHTDLSLPDTDSDGYTDGEEIKFGYNPLDSSPVKLKKKIEVNTKNQRLEYFLGGVRLGTMVVSSGVANTTPKGRHVISNKHPKAWSPYGLWMPYWMGLDNGRVGLHELPIWPNGYREGADHLGTPVSHGCIRLGTESAKKLYNWAELGTPVIIY